MTNELPPLWPHQSDAIRRILDAIANGTRWIRLVSPTGGGKSRIINELIKLLLLEREWLSVVYTNRKMLVDQLEAGLKGAGLTVGVRAAGRRDNRERPVQVASIQTEYSRSVKKENYLIWDVHPAHVVFVDEAHLQTGAMAQAILGRHYERGAVIIRVTATPLDIPVEEGEILIQAGVNSELRACGSLVPALHYGIEEPDMGCIGRKSWQQGDEDDLSEEEAREVMGRVGEDGKATPKLYHLFGRVLDDYFRLNPENKPTILFAPGVPESRWFAQEFTKKGIPAAHIDGKEIWVPGQNGFDGFDVKSDRVSRDELLGMSKNGTIRILCNRFVLREGIDCPWLAHGIFATAFGSLQTYLQSGGRLLRAYPGMASVTIQDHGGNGWRHGSLNEDRYWRLGASARVVAGMRADRLRDGKDKEPFLCPQCKLMLKGRKCVCGFELNLKTKKLRPVFSAEGELKLLQGDYFKPRRTKTEPDTQQLWDRMYHRARRSKKKMTFRQAYSLFRIENGYYPPWNLKNMPKEHHHQYLQVAHVPKDGLL